MHAFCAINDIVATTAYELADIAELHSSDPDILNNFNGKTTYVKTMCQALFGDDGFIHHTEYNKANLQNMYDEIFAGGYALLLMSATSSAEGHVALAYGVKENKELLIADSSFTPGRYIGGADKGIKYSMAYQNMIDAVSDVYIIKHK